MLVDYESLVVEAYDKTHDYFASFLNDLEKYETEKGTCAEFEYQNEPNVFSDQHRKSQSEWFEQDK